MNRFLRIIGLGLAIAACAVVYVRSLPPHLVAIGTPVRQDDFLYTVTRVERLRAGTDVEFAVTIRIDNQAKRVDYQWRDDNAFVTDANGRRYSPMGPADAADSARAPIPAGAHAEVNLAFVLPPDAQHPLLHYWNGVMMGDIFDFGTYARAAIAL